MVLYTLLCGTMPFDDSDMKHLVESITGASYPHPKGLTKCKLCDLCDSSGYCVTFAVRSWLYLLISLE